MSDGDPEISGRRKIYGVKKLKLRIMKNLRKRKKKTISPTSILSSFQKNPI